MAMENVMDRELEWNDEISKEGGGEFVLLPEGDYSFTVDSYERARHNGSEKLPPCNKAIVKIRISAKEGETILTHNLFLHTKTEGLLSEFFMAVGLKKAGEPLRMNWNMVPGATGRLKLGVRNYKNRDGEDRQANEIKKFYPKESQSFTPGKF